MIEAPAFKIVIKIFIKISGNFDKFIHKRLKFIGFRI